MSDQKVSDMAAAGSEDDDNDQKKPAAVVQRRMDAPSHGGQDSSSSSIDDEENEEDEFSPPEDNFFIDSESDSDFSSSDEYGHDPFASEDDEDLDDDDDDEDDDSDILFSSDELDSDESSDDDEQLDDEERRYRLYQRALIRLNYDYPYESVYDPALVDNLDLCLPDIYFLRRLDHFRRYERPAKRPRRNSGDFLTSLCHDAAVSQPEHQTHKIFPPSSTINGTDFTCFSSLPSTVQLVILQFLPVIDLVRVRQVDRTMRELIRDAIDTLWQPACERHWPWIKDMELSPTTKTTEDFARLLLDLSAKAAHEEQCMDEADFPHEVHYTDETKNVIQFTGMVGPSNRCIQATHALPQPKEWVTVRPLHANFDRPVEEWEAFVDQWKPFVSPFAIKDTTTGTVQVSLEPRLVSYFEVSILPPRTDTSGQRLRPDCVAIGLAAQYSLMGYSMPGWREESVGYHGDDGGIFDDSHWALLHRPRFGAGDCVGCGIDYHEAVVFFCKNGEVVHSRPIDLSDEWFPVVGLDSSCPITINFGTKQPFQFDLADYVKESQIEHVVNGLRSID